MADPFDSVPDSPPPEGRRRYAGPAKPQTRRWLGVMLAAIALAVAAVFACELAGVRVWPRHPDSLERITYRQFKDGSTDVFFTGRADSADARRLGDYLRDNGIFVEEHPVSVLYDERDGKPIISFFVAPQLELDDRVLNFYTALRLRIAEDVFPDRGVELQICDRNVRSVFSSKFAEFHVRRTLR